MNTQLTLKEQFLVQLDKIQKHGDSSHVTNLEIDENTATEIEQLTTELESINPNPKPLLNAISLLNGTWLLKYSTAREIRALASLPLGLKVGKVYQVINVANKSFFNIAFVQHPLKIISGFVKVAASFEPIQEDLSNLLDKRIQVNFEKRYLSIEKILGINTPQLNPFKVVPASNPKGRVPSLDITYLDETLRIGRGGDGSLFILTKSQDLPDKFR
ncbi:MULTISPECIES: PAP/fibrillin family protein [unclassified Tolypothrix]|uniref:PAP/fibrillin family protein n=1 Tax=unclassified Tolypothrix TaxID=2649714 RepID=UPI0005EAA363|nr:MULTISPECIES: PAP/fibrillin family protein [unclassified Tolypothrix]BAY94331.1 PAP fibrillin [Microchaete diplosiphon NIES-3275]EKF04089.1 PAP/fibrillin family protein [Tolypothrix sp. PCC 7601]MBE9087881.1 fimbrial protein [Tolypothrix sp. LEGE 11397]UYD28060.1 fimbrial protein [Tolypothrix sp. PCC 7712]UYD36070.1 fimbrial protein [Tolypothrix sp. PCC 7601]